MQEKFENNGDTIPYIGDILIKIGVLDKEKRNQVLNKMSEKNGIKSTIESAD